MTRLCNISVAAPGGPAPSGSVAETSVPFERGRLTHAEDLVVTSSNGKEMITQTRPAMTWPDSSIRWLHIVFEPSEGPGDYILRRGKQPSERQLLTLLDDHAIVDTGMTRFHVPKGGSTLLGNVEAVRPDCNGKQPIIGNHSIDLLMTRHDGKVFRASGDTHGRRLTVEESGPVRASIRLDGTCQAEDGDGLFNYIVRIQACRARPEIAMSVTWINATDEPGEQIRDMRLVFPFVFDADRLVFGCETGIYDGPFPADRPVHILQEDHNVYWARETLPDGRILNLSSGGCNGQHFPGWLYVRNARTALGVWVPGFFEEYPNEISVNRTELSVALWPERSADHLASKQILPSNPEGDNPYRHTHYWPLIPHPYLAFFDAEKKCLDVPQGLAKTQEIVLSPWTSGAGTFEFEKKWRAEALNPVRGTVDPIYVCSTRVCGPLHPRDSKAFPDAERVFEEAFGWFERHADVHKCYGKFDYGDFRYFVPSTTYMCGPGTKWEKKGEMPREGYWHNNERDPFRGILLHYLRTGNPKAWVLASRVARHLLDVDIRHHPHWGMYTHSYGHCYAALGPGGNSDHAWLLGLMEWAGVSGDPIVWDWLLRCGKYLAGSKHDFLKRDTRTTSLQVHMLCQFYIYTEERSYLDAAAGPLEALLKNQYPDGSWPKHPARSDTIVGFVEHAMVGVADYYEITNDKRCLDSLERAVTWAFPDGNVGPPATDAGCSSIGLYLHAIAVLGEKSSDRRYIKLAHKIFQFLDTSQNRSDDPVGRGDFWASWEVHGTVDSGNDDRPPQFCKQTRPLAPGTTLAYSPRCMWLMAKDGSPGL